jgi:hypothetical protein
MPRACSGCVFGYDFDTAKSGNFLKPAISGADDAGRWLQAMHTICRELVPDMFLDMKFVEFLLQPS